MTSSRRPGGSVQRALLSAALTASLTVPLAAQQIAKNAGGDSRTRVVQQAVAELGEPARALDAQRRLFHLGAWVVGPLREQLRRDEPTPAMRSRIVLVLGKLGRASLPALPELRDALLGGDAVLAANATWALGRVMPFADEREYELLAAAMSTCPCDSGPVDALRDQAQLGHAPSPQVLAERLSFHLGFGLGACRWLRANAEGVDDVGAFAALLRKQLDECTTRTPVAWQGAQPGWSGAPDHAEAWLAVTKSPLDGATARALLDHWDPDERLRAVEWLRDHGASLPFRERADLAGRLWDAEPDVAIAAAEAIAAWGTAGLVALVPLRSQQRASPDARIAAACRAAADAVLAACAAMPAADLAAVQAFDGALGGGPMPGLAHPVSPAGRTLLVEMLYVGQSQPGEQAMRALDLVEAAGAADGDDAIRSVFGWVNHGDAGVADAAFAWLARRGDAARHAGVDDLQRITRSSVADGARAAAAETMAWFATGDGTPDTLLAACDGDNVRVVARGLSALLQRPERGQLPAVERLWRLTALEGVPVVVRCHDRDRGVVVGTDASAPLRVLAAIALADAKFAIPDDRALAALVEERCGVELPSLQAHVATLRSKDELPALLDKLEAEMRQCMGVDPSLRWPSARAAK